ncbi:MAG TPA: hypothetical protein VMV05_01095 [bacterium]|nr:hypothetical protein [bacterium]
MNLRLALFLTLGGVSACLAADRSPEGPGNLFIHEKTSGFEPFKAAFNAQKENLKSHGFSAYSLHRDLKDSRSFILTLKCSNLKSAVDFIQSPAFQSAMRKGGVKESVLWEGLDAKGRAYADRLHPKGGIVIARNEVKSYKFWKQCFDAEGKHQHANRGYQASRYSIHYLLANPEVAYVVHEASDVSKAPAFMTSDHMKGIMEATGVTRIDIWYGINVEEGLF